MRIVPPVKTVEVRPSPSSSDELKSVSQGKNGKKKPSVDVAK